MKISARNVLAGKIQSVNKGATNAEVVLTLDGGETMTSIITNGAVDSLELKADERAYAVIKASEVMIGVGIDSHKLSARNVLSGKIASHQDGAVNGEVVVELPSGAAIVASITMGAIKDLGLKDGDNVSAIIKASSVLIGV